MYFSTLNIPNPLFFKEVKAQLDQGKKVKIRVRGSSMLPFLRDNDEALLIPPTTDKIKKGTPIIADTEELGIVLHRIYNIEDNRITLLGDGNTNQFEHTTIDKIIAIVSHFYRGKHTLRTDSLTMQIAGRIWMAAHPWRRYIVLLLWKLKHLCIKKK